MTDAELHDAIFADEAAKGMADVGNDGGCAARMGEILPPVVGQYIPVDTLIYWGSGAVRAKMDRASKDDASPVQSLAISYMDMIRKDSSKGLDIQDPRIVGPGGMLDAFAAVGIFAPSGPGSKADLIAQAPTSPAVVSADQVSRAWLQYRPGGRVVAS